MQTAQPVLSLRRRGPAQRSLFGPVDREQLRAECQAALQRDLQEASRRWAYDFASDRPLEGGDLRWEGVPSAKVPPLYRPSLLRPAQGGRRGTPEAAGPPAPQRTPLGLRAEKPHHHNNNNNTNNNNNNANRPRGASQDRGRHLKERRAAEKTPEKDENGRLKRKQTNITDFYQAKRRVVDTARKSGRHVDIP